MLYVYIAVLAFALAVQPARALLIVGPGPYEEPVWVTQALKSGKLDDTTLRSARHQFSCIPAECDALWQQAIVWMKQNTHSLNILPSLNDSDVNLRTAYGLSNEYADTTLQIQMGHIKSFQCTYLSAERFHDFTTVPTSDQLIEGIKVVAAFNRYMRQHTLQCHSMPGCPCG